jgi:hypothetical protein
MIFLFFFFFLKKKKKKDLFTKYISLKLYSTLARGSLNRQVGSTDMNSQSSRSHAIFSVVMSQQQKSSNSPISPTNSNSGTPRMGSRPPSRTQQRMSKRLDDVENVTITSKFNFVDLAGSERVSYLSYQMMFIMIAIYLKYFFFTA